MKPSPNCFLCWWIVPWASPTPRYVTRNWNCHRLDRTVHWFHSFVIFSDFAEEFKFFTDQVRPALGSVGCFGWFWPCSGSHIYRHICLNHQRTHQTNLMAPWDSLDVPFDPLGPLSPEQLKTKCCLGIADFCTVYPRSSQYLFIKRSACSSEWEKGLKLRW